MPPNAGELVVQVEPAYRSYWAAVERMRQSGGGQSETAALGRAMTAKPLEYWQGVAAQFRSNGIRTKGAFTIVNVDVTMTALDKNGGGRAQLRYCIDRSTLSYETTAGGKADVSTAPGRFLKGNATMVVVDGVWKLDDAKETRGDSC